MSRSCTFPPRLSDWPVRQVSRAHAARPPLVPLGVDGVGRVGVAGRVDVIEGDEWKPVLTGRDRGLTAPLEEDVLGRGDEFECTAIGQAQSFAFRLRDDDATLCVQLHRDRHESFLCGTTLMVSRFHRRGHRKHGAEVGVRGEHDLVLGDRCFEDDGIAGAAEPDGRDVHCVVTGLVQACSDAVVPRVIREPVRVSSNGPS